MTHFWKFLHRRVDETVIVTIRKPVRGGWDDAGRFSLHTSVDSDYAFVTNGRESWLEKHITVPIRRTR